MNNLKTQLFTLRDEDMRDFSFIVTKEKYCSKKELIITYLKNIKIYLRIKKHYNDN